MNNIDNILSKDNFDYSDVVEFLQQFDENQILKILSRINKFNEEDKKKVCKDIIASSKNESIVDRVCMEIITFIKYEYEYYKEVLEIIIERNYKGTWISEIKTKLVEDVSNSLQLTFIDFSLEQPLSIEFDIEIMQKLLEIYDKEYVQNIELNRKQILTICDRLTCIMNFSILNLLNLFLHFDEKIEFSYLEVEQIFSQFVFDFPYTCKEFIEECVDAEKKSIFLEYLKEKTEKFFEEEKIKFGMKIFKPNSERINKYRRYKVEQNKLIIKEAKQKSLFLNFCKNDTILYGKTYGLMTIARKDKKISIGNMHSFEYKYPYPIKYIIDPVEYMMKINSLKMLGKEK